MESLGHQFNTTQLISSRTGIQAQTALMPMTSLIYHTKPPPKEPFIDCVPLDH